MYTISSVEPTKSLASPRFFTDDLQRALNDLHPGKSLLISVVNVDEFDMDPPLRQIQHLVRSYINLRKKFLKGKDLYYSVEWVSHNSENYIAVSCTKSETPSLFEE